MTNEDTDIFAEELVLHEPRTDSAAILNFKYKKSEGGPMGIQTHMRASAQVPLFHKKAQWHNPDLELSIEKSNGDLKQSGPKEGEDMATQSSYISNPLKSHLMAKSSAAPSWQCRSRQWQNSAKARTLGGRGFQIGDANRDFQGAKLTIQVWPASSLNERKDTKVERKVNQSYKTYQEYKAMKSLKRASALSHHQSQKEARSTAPTKRALHTSLKSAGKPSKTATQTIEKLPTSKPVAGPPLKKPTLKQSNARKLRPFSGGRLVGSKNMFVAQSFINPLDSQLGMHGVKEETRNVKRSPPSTQEGFMTKTCTSKISRVTKDNIGMKMQVLNEQNSQSISLSGNPTQKFLHGMPFDQRSKSDLRFNKQNRISRKKMQFPQSKSNLSNFNAEGQKIMSGQMEKENEYGEMYGLLNKPGKKTAASASTSGLATMPKSHLKFDLTKKQFNPVQTMETNLIDRSSGIDKDKFVLNTSPSGEDATRVPKPTLLAEKTESQESGARRGSRMQQTLLLNPHMISKGSQSMLQNFEQSTQHQRSYQRTFIIPQATGELNGQVPPFSRNTGQNSKTIKMNDDLNSDLGKRTEDNYDIAIKNNLICNSSMYSQEYLKQLNPPELPQHRQIYSSIQSRNSPNRQTKIKSLDISERFLGKKPARSAAVQKTKKTTIATDVEYSRFNDLAEGSNIHAEEKSLKTSNLYKSYETSKNGQVNSKSKTSGDNFIILFNNQVDQTIDNQFVIENSFSAGIIREPSGETTIQHKTLGPQFFPLQEGDTDISRGLSDRNKIFNRHILSRDSSVHKYDRSTLQVPYLLNSQYYSEAKKGFTMLDSKVSLRLKKSTGYIQTNSPSKTNSEREENSDLLKKKLKRPAPVRVQQAKYIDIQSPKLKPDLNKKEGGLKQSRSQVRQSRQTMKTRNFPVSKTSKPATRESRQGAAQVRSSGVHKSRDRSLQAWAKEEGNLQSPPKNHSVSPVRQGSPSPKKKTAKKEREEIESPQVRRFLKPHQITASTHPDQGADEPQNLILTTTDFIGIKENEEDMSYRTTDSCGVREVFSHTMKQRNRDVQDTLDFLHEQAELEADKNALGFEVPTNGKVEQLKDIKRNLSQISYCLKKSIVVDQEEKFIVFKEKQGGQSSTMSKIIEVVAGSIPIYCKVLIPYDLTHPKQNAGKPSQKFPSFDLRFRITDLQQEEREQQQAVSGSTVAPPRLAISKKGNNDMLKELVVITQQSKSLKRRTGVTPESIGIGSPSSKKMLNRRFSLLSSTINPFQEMTMFEESVASPGMTVQPPPSAIGRPVKKLKPKVEDLAIYVSSSTKEPFEGNYEIAQYNSTGFSYNIGSPLQYVYFTLKSKEGSRVRLCLDFVTEQQRSKNYSKMDFGSAHNKDLTMKLYKKYNPEGSTDIIYRSDYERKKFDTFIVRELSHFYKKEIKQMIRKGEIRGTHDFVKKNKICTQFLTRKHNAKKVKKQTLEAESKDDQAKAKREFIEQEMQQHFSSKLARWDEYRQLRELAQNAYIFQIKSKRRVKEILSQVQLQQVVLTLKANIERQKDLIRLKLYAATISVAFYNKFQAYYCRRYGLEYKHRMKNYIRRILSLLCGVLMMGKHPMTIFRKERLGIDSSTQFTEENEDGNSNLRGSSRMLLNPTKEPFKIQTSVFEERAKGILFEFLKEVKSHNSVLIALKKHKSKRFLAGFFENYVVVRLMRQRYILNKCEAEIEFLINHYRGMTNKRSRMIIQRLQQMNMTTLDMYLRNFVQLKSYCYRFYYADYLVNQCETRINFHRLYEQQASQNYQEALKWGKDIVLTQKIYSFETEKTQEDIEQTFQSFNNNPNDDQHEKKTQGTHHSEASNNAVDTLKIKALLYERQQDLKRTQRRIREDEDSMEKIIEAKEKYLEEINQLDRLLYDETEIVDTDRTAFLSLEKHLNKTKNLYGQTRLDNLSITLEEDKKTFKQTTDGSEGGSKKQLSFNRKRPGRGKSSRHMVTTPDGDGTLSPESSMDAKKRTFNLKSAESEVNTSQVRQSKELQIKQDSTGMGPSVSPEALEMLAQMSPKDSNKSGKRKSILRTQSAVRESKSKNTDSAKRLSLLRQPTVKTGSAGKDIEGIDQIEEEVRPETRGVKPVTIPGEKPGKFVVMPTREELHRIIFQVAINMGSGGKMGFELAVNPVKGKKSIKQQSQPNSAAGTQSK